MSKCLSVGFFLSAPARLGIVWTGDFWSNCITKKLFFFFKGLDNFRGCEFFFLGVLVNMLVLQDKIVCLGNPA